MLRTIILSMSAAAAANAGVDVTPEGNTRALSLNFAPPPPPPPISPPALPPILAPAVGQISLSSVFSDSSSFKPFRAVSGMMSGLFGVRNGETPDVTTGTEFLQTPTALELGLETNSTLQELPVDAEFALPSALLKLFSTSESAAEKSLNRLFQGQNGVTTNMLDQLLRLPHLSSLPLSKLLSLTTSQDIKDPTAIVQALNSLTGGGEKLNDWPTLFLDSLLKMPDVALANTFNLDLIPAFVEMPTLMCFALSLPEFVKMEAPVQHRETLLMNVAMYEAAVPYHDTWKSFFTSDGTDQVRFPQQEQTSLNRKRAAVNACYTYFQHSAPKALMALGQGLRLLGFSPSLSPSQGTPEYVGMQAAKRVILDRADDGMNADGSMSNPVNPLPYEDWTDFEPANTPRQLKYPTYWQPLKEAHTSGDAGSRVGYNVIQTHIAPQAGRAKPFFLTAADVEAARVPSMFQCSAPLPPNHVDEQGINAGSDIDCKEVLKERSRVVLEKAKVLVDDEKKMLAEFFDNKLISIAPLAFRLIPAYKLSFDSFMLLELGFSGVLFDVTIPAWKEKVRFNAVRPQSFVNAFMADEEFETYVPNVGVRNITGRDWRSYFRTMPHAEYPSGSACFCSSFAEFGELVTGDDDISEMLVSTFPQGSSGVEPGVSPKTTIKKKWSGWNEVAAACRESRLWTGVHYSASVAPEHGGDLCKGMASKVFAAIERISGQKLSIEGIRSRGEAQ